MNRQKLLSRASLSVLLAAVFFGVISTTAPAQMVSYVKKFIWPELNVQDYGSCTWDGVSDVSPCVQTAITAAVAAGGSTVVLPAGVIPIKTSLTTTGPFSMRGAGPGTILKPTSDNVNASSVLLMALGTVSGVTISNLVFDGGNESGTQTNPLVQLFHTDKVTFQNVNWQNAAGIGLNGSGANGTKIVNALVNKVGNRWKTTLSASDRHAGLSFCCGDGTTLGFDTQITGSRFSDIGLDAINLGTTTRTVIANNVFYLENNQRALMVLTNYPAAIYGVNEKYLTISGNIVNQAQGNGIDLPGVQFSSISGNTISLSGQAGIGLFLGVDLSTQVTDVVVAGNTVSNNKQWTASPWTGAISIGGPSGGPQGSPDRVTIAANNLVDTQGSPTQPYGVQITVGATPTNLLISTSNNITGNVIAQFLNANWAPQTLTIGTTTVTPAAGDSSSQPAPTVWVAGGPANYSANNVQTFNTSGTWTKPANATWVIAYAYPSGTGGTYGFACPNVTICSGSSGPGGGSVGYWEGPASALTSTVTVTIGATGMGGSSGSPAGTLGGNATFGTYATGYPGLLGTVGLAVTATVGGNGAGLNGSSGVFGATTNANYLYGGAAGAASSAAGATADAKSALLGGSGGGAGCGILTGGTASVGSAPQGNFAGFNFSTTANLANGAPGISSANIAMGGGGAGGGCGVGANAGNGGVGGTPGGPGGSGGDGYNGTTPGNGGNGATGRVVVIAR